MIMKRELAILEELLPAQMSREAIVEFVKIKLLLRIQM